MISLPNHLWFIQNQGGRYVTNEYTGSVCDQPQEGCTNKTTFHYRAVVIVNKEDDTSILYVECFWRKPWNVGGTTEPVQHAFLSSQEGIDEAQAWLEEQYAAGCPE